MADIEKLDDFPEDFGLTEADLAEFDPDDPDFEDPFKDELPLELQSEVKGLTDEEPPSKKETEDPIPPAEAHTEQFEEFDIDYSLEDDAFPELDADEVTSLPTEPEKQTTSTTSSKSDGQPAEVEDGELDGYPTGSTNREAAARSNTAQGSHAYRPRDHQATNQRRPPVNNQGFPPGMRYMPYRPLNGNPRPNGMMPGMRPFPGGTIHVNPNFRGYQQRPPFPMNPVTPFGMPMMGMQPWMMNGRGYSDVRPAFGHKQGKPSDLSNPMPRKPQTMNRNRPERDQPSQESRKNGASNGKRAYNHESLEERKKHHADNSSVDRKQQNNPKTDSAKSQGEGQANTKGVRVVVSNIASSVSRPQLIEMADSIKKGSIQSVVIDRRNNQAEMIFQTTDSAKMFRRKFHRSALAENHITINISG